MSRIRHDSPDAERLALFWHRLGVVLSGASAILAIGGLFWHRWAVRQHQEALHDLTNPSSDNDYSLFV